MNKKSMLISRILAKSFLATIILVISVNDQAKSSLKIYSQVSEIISEKSLTNTSPKAQLNKKEPNTVSSQSESPQNLLTQTPNNNKTETAIPLNSKAQSKKQEPPFWILIPIFLVTVLIYKIVLWRKPTLLLKLPAEISVPKIGEVPSIKIPVPFILFIKYRPRVLDAWVNERIQQVRLEFKKRPTVDRRSVHISLPIQLDEEKIDSLELNNKTLQQIFAKQEVKLLIFGEGGIGKTSWACQLAKWAMAGESNQRLCQHLMIPIMIEDELEAVDSTSALSTIILRQLKNLSDDEKPISEELLNQLLKKRRLLIIVDHISEMSEASRKALASRLKDPNALFNALVITSRAENIFGSEVTYSLLRPQRIVSGQLLKFMDDYLQQLNKRNLFPNDAEYIDDFKRLSLIVSGKRDITVLFAKLYLDQMVAKAEGRLSDRMPENIPDLMLSYLNELNYNLIEKELSSEIVHKAAKITAWECLKVGFKPETTERDTILEALVNSESEGKGTDTAKKNLLYLEERLQIIRRSPFSPTKVRFELDPLAEYLASLFLVEKYKNNISEWENLLNRLESVKGKGEEINGFLFALRDSCISKSKEYGIPSFIIDRLSELSGVDIEEIEYQQIIQRIKRLTENLSDASYEEVRQINTALEEVTGINRRFNPARQKLVLRALINLSSVDNPVFRAKIIELLGKTYYLSEQVLHILKKSLKDSDPHVRISTVHACAGLRLSTDNISTLLDDFLNCLNDENQMVRTNTASAIGHLRLKPEEIEVAVQALLDCFNYSDDYITSSFAVLSLGNIGPLYRQAEFVLKIILDYMESDRFKIDIQYSTGKDLFAGALGNFNPPDYLRDRVFQSLKSLLNDSEDSTSDTVRLNAARSLGKLSPIIGGNCVSEICNQLQNEKDEHACYEMVGVISELIDTADENSRQLIKRTLEIAFCVEVIKHTTHSRVLPNIVNTLKRFGLNSDDFESFISASFNDKNIRQVANLNLKSVLMESSSYY
jgi:HEAT repeat protein